MSRIITHNGMTLVVSATKAAVRRGDKLTTFRGEPVVITGGRSPDHPGSTGRVWCVSPGRERDGDREYFPGVVDCEWTTL